MATRRSFLTLMATVGSCAGGRFGSGRGKGRRGRRRLCRRGLRAGVAQARSNLDVTLVASGKAFSACPFNSSVIAGLREPAQQEFSYDSLAALGIKVATAGATAVDPAAATLMPSAAREL